MKYLFNLIVMLCLFSSSFALESGSITQNQSAMKVVILDPGHGGIHPITKEYVTKGKRSTVWEDGSVYYEGVGNRDIVKKATKMLERKGVKVLHTVSPDNYKDVSLTSRVRIANKHYLNHGRKPFLISVHSNGFKRESAHGTEVFTSIGDTLSDEISTLWMDEFSKEFPSIKRRPDYSDGDIDKEAKFTIITKTYCPAILIESMFHTNKKECRMLMQEYNREKIARVICNTVLKFNA